ncbi:phosphopeptide-binding protein, partial [Georgenia sp. 10Sc9-8]|nr:phosphopeptide-binding protein [Georgenia halotolerans]
PRDVLAATSPPGRGMTDGGLELQVAVVGGTAVPVEQVSALARLAADLRGRATAVAPPVRRAPELVRSEDLPEHVRGRPVLGLAVDTLEPVGFEPAGTFLVTGPPGSGRSNAVHWLTDAVARVAPNARLVHLGTRRTALAGRAGWHRSATGDDAAEVARSVAALFTDPAPEGRTTAVLVVEDLPDFLAGPAETALTELIKKVRRNGHLLLAEGESSAWTAPWPLLTEVRAGRRGLVLQPDGPEGEAVLRTLFPRVRRTDFPPGRALVADRGHVRPVHLPLVVSG